MKTWLTLPGALLLLLVLNSDATTIQDGVLIQKVGATYLFIFPSYEGRLKASDNPAGTISIGSTVTVAYALKIIKGGRARFVGVDGSTIPPDVFDTLKVALKTQRASKLFGFMVRDTRQPKLDITISPEFMAKVKNKRKLTETVVREGNLNLILAPDAEGFKIVSVVLD